MGAKTQAHQPPRRTAVLYRKRLPSAWRRVHSAVLAVVAAASAAPSFLGKTYGGDPKSKKDVGIFTARKEMIHGRLAMLAIAYEVYAELSARGVTAPF